MSHDRLGLLAVTAAAAGWAVAAVVARGLFERGVPPLALAGARAAIAAAGLTALAHRRQRGLLPPGARSLVVLGLAIALVNATYYLAIERLSVAVAIVLQYTAPVLVVTWTAIALRRRPGAEVIAALVLAVAGVALVSGITGGAGRLDPAGIAFGLASAALFALYTVLSERAGAVHGVVDAMRGAFLVATAFWIVVLAPQGVPGELVAPANLAGIVFIGLGGTLAPFLLYVWGIRRVRAERATIAATLEPVLAALVAWVWLGQSLGPAQILGGTFVLVAVVLLQLRRAEALRPAEV